MNDAAMRRLCQRTIADEPRWLEAYALLADPTAHCEALESSTQVAPAAWLVRHDAAGLGVVVGQPSATIWTEVLHRHPNLAILFDDNYQLLIEAARHAGRHVVGVSFALQTEAAPILAGAAPLDLTENLDHVEPVLRAELTRVRHDRTVWAVRVDGLPVAFAYAGWRSPTWFDVSVDTVREFRQLGLASITVAALLDDEIAQGRQPVWGAVDDNVASQRLAGKLGFTVHSRAAMVVPVASPQVGR